MSTDLPVTPWHELELYLRGSGVAGRRKLAALLAEHTGFVGSMHTVEVKFQSIERNLRAASGFIKGRTRLGYARHLLEQTQRHIEHLAQAFAYLEGHLDPEEARRYVEPMRRVLGHADETARKLRAQIVD